MRLRVVEAQTSPDPIQDCGVCQMNRVCYMPKIKEEHVVLSLLFCRIKRGYEVNRSSKLVLKMVYPKLKTLAEYAIRGTNIDLDTALADLQSMTIELIQKTYVMGDVAYPLHFLFGEPKGRILLYAKNYARSEKRFDEHHALYANPNDVEEEEGYDPQSDEDTTTDSTRIARDVLDDGLTLTLQEYRVLSFCLANASDQKRPVNGLHVYLGRVMAQPRAKITKLSSDATEKLKKEVLNRL